MSQSLPFDPKVRQANFDGDEALPRPPPRRPKPETERRLQQGGPPVQLPHSAMRGSTPLSANAKEFVPRIAVPAISPFSHPPMPPGVPPPEILDSLNQLSLGPPQGPGGGGRGGGMPPMDEQVRTMAMDFSQAMANLTSRPGNVRDYLKPLCQRLRMATSPQVLQTIIKILYEQSVYEPNFRYTGARVVHDMSNELKDHPIFGNFKMEFLKACQDDYNQREQLKMDKPEGIQKLCGLTMFMGELFENVTADAKGHTERLSFLPSVLCDLVMTLLSDPSDISVKTACQLLKLAGGNIEDAMKKKLPHEAQVFDSVFMSLQNIQNSSFISPNMQSLVRSVLSLREKNWGRGDSKSQAAPENHYPPVTSYSLPHLPHQQTTHNYGARQQDFRAEPTYFDQVGNVVSREALGLPAEEEEEEEDLDDIHVFTDEEERDYLQWQAEINQTVSQGASEADPLCQGDYDYNPQYQQWSTNDSDYNSHANYVANDSGYPSNDAAYIPTDNTYSYYDGYSSYGDDGLMDDEAEKAYDEFLSQQQQRR